MACSGPGDDCSSREPLARGGLCSCRACSRTPFRSSLTSRASRPCPCACPCPSWPPWRAPGLRICCRSTRLSVSAKQRPVLWRGRAWKRLRFLHATGTRWLPSVVAFGCSAAWGRAASCCVMLGYPRTWGKLGRKCLNLRGELGTATRPSPSMANSSSSPASRKTTSASATLGRREMASCGRSCRPPSGQDGVATGSSSFT
mmetsp:Transcript_102049/g.327481  ORF Transcript_102049/g.327481 Transcript_102049/m.327481 type:complete len:201 (+) Transcript_102049:2141-2743(+)